MRILFWIVRILLSIGLIISCARFGSNIDSYESDVYLADSAPQATQLSGEYILKAISELSPVIADVTFFIIFELIVISYYLRKRTAVSEVTSNIKKSNDTQKNLS